MSCVTAKKRDKKYYVGSVLAAVVILAFGRIIPAWGSITVVGVSCLGILLGMIIAIICTGEVLWATMFAMVALTLYGYYQSFDEAIGDIFGNPLVYSFFLITGILCSAPFYKTIKNRLGSKNPKIMVLADSCYYVFQLCLFVISFSFLVMKAHNPFIYFNF